MALVGKLGYYKIVDVKYDKTNHVLMINIIRKNSKNSLQENESEIMYRVDDSQIDQSNLIKSAYELLKSKTNNYFDNFEYNEGGDINDV